jgi:hypothetical protein
MTIGPDGKPFDVVVRQTGVRLRVVDETYALGERRVLARPLEGGTARWYDGAELKPVLDAHSDNSTDQQHDKPIVHAPPPRHEQPTWPADRARAYLLRAAAAMVEDGTEIGGWELTRSAMVSLPVTESTVRRALAWAGWTPELIEAALMEIRGSGRIVETHGTPHADHGGCVPHDLHRKAVEAISAERNARERAERSIDTLMSERDEARRVVSALHDAATEDGRTCALLGLVAECAINAIRATQREREEAVRTLAEATRERDEVRATLTLTEQGEHDRARTLAAVIRERDRIYSLAEDSECAVKALRDELEAVRRVLAATEDRARRLEERHIGQ